MEEFVSTESSQLLRKPPITIHYGPCPWTDCVRSKVAGRKILFKGEIRTVKGIEAYAKIPEPKLGELIGLILD